MKNFLNYSKNRILYNIFRMLFVFLMVFLVSKCEVKALPTLENYSESATNKYLLGRVYSSASTLDLFGMNGTGSECGTVSSPNPHAPLKCWENKKLSLSTYTSSLPGLISSISLLSLTPVIVGETYTVTINYTLSNSNYSTIASWLVFRAEVGTVLNYSSRCDGVNCTIRFAFKSAETTDFVWISGDNATGTSYTFSTLNSMIKYLYMPTVVEGNTMDSEINIDGVIEQQQQTNNKLDEIKDQNDQTNEKLDSIEDAITDDTPPNTDALQNSAGWLPAGPVDSILNLPLTLFNSLLNNLGASCTPVELPLPYVNKTLILPCFNSIADKINGFSTWWNGIGVVASAFILYSYLLKLYKWVDDTLTFRENTWQDWGGV